MNTKSLIYKSYWVKYLVLFSALFVFISFGYGNDSQKDSLNKVIKSIKVKAIKYDRNNDVYNAIEYYNLYLCYKSKDVKLNFRLANLYFITRDYSKANQYYDSVVKFNYKKFPLAFYSKGIVCMNLEKYDEAIESFAKFKKAFKVSNDKSGYRKLAAIYTESAEWAKGHLETDGEVDVTHPGGTINHANIDFAPFPIDDNNMIYGAVYLDTAKHGSQVRQIYKATKVNGQWKSQGLLAGEINNPEFNTGNAVVSDDGQCIYFTRSRKNWQNADICEIFVSRYDGNIWQTPEKLPYPVNDENYTSTQPAMGKNLKTGNDILYFVSNRPGGKGGLDIWYTEYNNKTNTYKEPLDLDKGVNSVGDECCPFYDISSRTLYFSSKGRKNGFGGFDIYKAVGSSRKWAEAVPLPKPINSSYDESYYTIFKNNKKGFFTSNRPGSLAFGNGSCCDDIFTFKINRCARVYSWGTIRNSVNYDLYHHLNDKYHLGLEYPENNVLLSDVPVELYLAGEKEVDDILIAKTTTNKDGNYSFELERNKHYNIVVKNYGYFEKRVALSSIGINCNDTLGIGTTPINYLPKVNVRINIYYDHDKYKLSDSAQRTIDTTLMPLFDLFPNAIIEVGSHTDSVGTDLYNLKLSQKRSESVVNYLISKGIPNERVVAIGYGMRSPIAPNTNKDGSDNPLGRQMNRRTEIKIIGEMKSFNIEE